MHEAFQDYTYSEDDKNIQGLSLFISMLTIG